MVLAARKEGGQEISTLGPLIHNPQVVAKLGESGIKVVESLDQVESGTIVIPSHGMNPELIAEAKKRNLKILDATCPFVAKAQEYTRLLAEQGYRILVLGDPGHPEVMGLLGCAQGKAQVIQSVQEVEGLPASSKIGVVVQTTQALARLRELVAALVDKAQELRVFNTICQATSELQQAALELAREVDVMIVVGGKNSANTNRLRQLCESAGVTAYHIETADELDPAWFESKQTIGVTAGASTPQWLIDEVVKRLGELGSGG